jgi:hypothetical protein
MPATLIPSADHLTGAELELNDHMIFELSNFFLCDRRSLGRRQPVQCTDTVLLTSPPRRYRHRWKSAGS